MQTTTQDEFDTNSNCTNLNYILEALKYREWAFRIIRQASYRAMLEIGVVVADSTKETVEWLFIRHQFQVPYFFMSREQLEDWIFDCIMLVHRHEAAEEFKIAGEAIFYPEHGEGADSYLIKRRT